MKTSQNKYLRQFLNGFCLLIVIPIGSTWGGNLQVTTDHKDDDKLSSVKLTLVKQERLQEQQTCGGLLTSHDSDVFVVFEDDLTVQFRLANNGKTTVYYLASIYEPTPTGYILYRQVGDSAEWQSTTPARGREGSFTGGGYRWLPLLPGNSIEFEFSDLSRRKGEHAAAVLLNTQPDHVGRVEVISESYRPLEKNVGSLKHRR